VGPIRRLGRTDLDLTAVGFGSQRTDSADLIRSALDQGVNHIETSPFYFKSDLIRRVIEGRRDSVHLFVAFFPLANVQGTDSYSQLLRRTFEETLRDLGTDHIDVFLWHGADEPEHIVDNEGVELMLRWRDEGKIRWCGASFHSNQDRMLAQVADVDLYDVALVAFNQSSPHSHRRAVAEAARRGVGIIAMKTQSPHYNDPERGTIGDAPDHREALAWVLGQEGITAAIPGMTTANQLALNLRVMRGES
jgi:aryl-alcohol dehydrogenase-like predicted oxidoreductase